MNDKRIFIEEENNKQSPHWQSSLWEDFIEPELLTITGDETFDYPTQNYPDR